MPSIKIVAKEGHEVLSQTTDKNSVALTEASVVTLGVAKADISEIQRNGADVVIRLKSGEVIVIQNFYSTTTATDNSLVLEDGNQLLWVKLTDETGAFLAEVVYEPLTTIEPLLYTDGVPLWAWAAGAVAVGGLAAGLGGGGSDGGNGGGDQGPSAAYKAAEAAVKAAENAYKAAEKAVTEAKKDGNITQQEHDDLVKAVEDAEKAKTDAQKKVEALPADAVGDLKDRLDALTKPTVNDLPAVGETTEKSEAEAAVKAAENAYKAAEKAVTEAKKDGNITQQEHDDLVKAVEDAEKAKTDAQKKVEALPADAVGDLKDRLDALTKPTVNDLPAVGEITEFTEAADLLADAKAAVDAAVDARDAAIADGKVEQPEIDALNDAIINAQGKLNDAKDAIDALPAGTAKDALVTEAGTEQDRLDAIDVPAVDADDFDDVADLLADAKAAVDNAEQKLADAIADGKVEQSEIDDLEAAIAEAQGKLDDAEAAINNLPDGDAKDDLVAELGTEQERLGDIVVPAENGSEFDAAQAALDDAKQAVADAEQALEDAIADGVATDEELQALQDAIDNAQGKLDDAETAINNLPEGSAKDDLLGELATEQEKLDGITAPDSDQAALDAAQ
ncbi:GA-like domain-containing protein, partial [Acinetobacter towneri]|uniref:GA-like domain-containing protein n=1 Tax=Acinetobacter towneri TaxID=202956 RepID=UPI0034D3F066